MHKFKVGDYVKVVSSLGVGRRWGHGHSLESDIWQSSNTWVSEMDSSVGRCFSVTKIESGGYRLCFSCRGSTYGYPEAVLELADKTDTVEPNPREVRLWT